MGAGAWLSPWGTLGATFCSTRNGEFATVMFKLYLVK
jgi:hypothetical protein